MATLAELLLDEGGRRVTELAVVAIDRLCGCAEGRSDLVAHPAGLAVVSKKAMRVSLATTESAVRALHAVARHSPTPAVLQEMLAVGVVAKLMLVLQVDALTVRPPRPGPGPRRRRWRRAGGGARRRGGTGGNEFSGTTPADAFAGMGWFKKIVLSSNNFSGPNTASLADVPKLVALQLNDKKFQGKIPDLALQLVEG